ncbi:MAG: acyl-CoA/acyl-ACP dehydrogenase [Chloroflexi bacterium]|nr:acyl-CoA/acyl-ACP dehydrogenase [Chloroflexota bacterium]
MDFGLNETQELIRSSAADYLSDRSPSDFVRAMATDERGYTDDFWREIGELGWLGLIVPEEHGGSGMDMSDMAVLLAEWGAALAPGPFVESAVVSASAIDHFGSDAQKQEWLPTIAMGETVAVPSLVGVDGSTDPSALGVRASETSNGWVLSGTSRFVPYGNSADLVLMPAETEAGINVFAVPIKSAEGTVNINRVKMASGAPACDIEMNEVVVPNAAVLGEAGGGTDVVDHMMLYGAAARATQMVGAGSAVADRTIEYVKDRRQFGRPIGAFQVIQHYMADMATKVKSAQHLANRAAWALSADLDGAMAARIVSQAKWSANTLMHDIVWKAHQSHGAIGFTWEHDLHLYTRRVLSWRADFGDSDSHIENLGRTL